MIHLRRRMYKVRDCSEQPLCEFSALLVRNSWCLCNGFRFRHLLLLNDSFSEDGAQEFAVFDTRSGDQVDSLTVSWMTEVDLCEKLQDMLQWPEGDNLEGNEPLPHPEGPCSFCA